MITAGIDIGSRNTKVVVWDTGKAKIIQKKVSQTGTDPTKTAINLLERVLAENGQTSRSLKIISTGYGRKLLNIEYISEISCHAKGVRKMHSQVRTVIDIGGQDSKAISMAEDGIVVEFAMNDKCAAGTGSFLEKMAELFDTPVVSLGNYALKSCQEVDISSTCVVFAESEIISLLNRNIAKEDILMGVHRSIARRIRNMLSGMEWQSPVVLTGGVAQNQAVIKALRDVLQTNITVASEPFYSGALGAALFAAGH